MDPNTPTSVNQPDRLSTALSIGPVLLFLAAIAYGILEVHSSTDTWIGLTAGRQIFTADEFPKTDTFSYTFHGQPWYNQNWLTHVFQYWLYSHIAPNAVIYGTWAMSASVFVLVLLAAYWRSGTWLGALLAASIVGLGCRDFLSARPATTGFFCIASLWALLCALEGQRDRHRWWPIILLLPLLLVWGNAHGSFVFGYAVLGLYVGHWFVVRTIRTRHSWAFSLLLALLVILIGGVLYSAIPPGARIRPDQALVVGSVVYGKKKLALLCVALVAYVAYWAAIRYFRPRVAVSDRQVAAIVGVVAAALILTVAVGPFGIDNFTHGQKVAGSEVFRQVSEWLPPFAPGRHFPPTWRFKTILGFSLATLLACWLLSLFATGTARPARAADRLHTSLFDVAVVVIGLSMTFWARRFAPIYFIFGAPVFLTWIVRLLGPLKASLRRYLRLGVMAFASLFVIAVAAETGYKTRRELVTHFERQPQLNLLKRVTRYDLTPHDAIVFLKDNQLSVNVLTEWTQAGPVMFFVPGAKVFMDGRAQQVYDEAHYRRYYALLVAPDAPQEYMMRILDQYHTDAVLLRRAGKTKNLGTALSQSPDWMPVLMGPRFILFFRRDSRGLARLGELLRRGEEWRPDSPLALATRGLVWKAITPPDPEQALACWRTALRRDVSTGSTCFLPVARTLCELGRVQEAQEFLEHYYQKLNRPIEGLSNELRRQLLKTLARCWRETVSSTPTKQQADDRDD